MKKGILKNILVSMLVTVFITASIFPIISGQGETYFYANQDIPVSNSEIINDYTYTQDSDDQYEGIVERESEENLAKKRHSYLEHKWRIDVTGGYSSYEFNLEAHHTNNIEGDNFMFAYSTDGSIYTDMITVTKTSDDDANQVYTFQEGLSGAVYIRVNDLDRSRGNRVLDSIFIDHMYIVGDSGYDVTPPVIYDVDASVSDNVWYNMTPTVVGGTLIPREKHAMAFDSNAGCAIMVGGSREGPIEMRYSNETWAYNYANNTWFNRTTEISPPARRDHAMAYNSQADKTILYGGWEGGVRFTGTWAYDFQTNTWTNMTLFPNYSEVGGTLIGRDSSALVYDSKADRIIMFGGDHRDVQFYSDTWVYDYNNNTWYNMTPTINVIGGPMPVEGIVSPAMAYDAANDLTVLFGGVADFGDDIIRINWTYVYDYNTNTWENKSSTMTIIGGDLKSRIMHTMCYDSHAELVIMSCGTNTEVGRLSDTWTYDTAENTWYYMNPAEVNGIFHPREESVMVYDSVNMRSILYSGWFSGQPIYRIDDTWAYNIDDLAASITWVTDEPADSVVNYGTTTALGNTISDSALVTEHKIVLTDVLPDITYYFEVQSTDEAENTAVDDNNDNYYTFFTGQDTTPPVITNVQSSDITYNSATITWNTDESSNSRVNYGTTTALGDTESDSAMVTSHSIFLTDLIPDTTYYYEAQSTDEEANTATDNNNGNFYTFTTTSEPDNQMHVYSIDMWYEQVKNKYNIYTQVKIVNAIDNPVEGAEVYIEVLTPVGIIEYYNDITASDGTVTFLSGPTPKSGTFTSTVTDVIKTDWIYDYLNNVETSEQLTVP